MSSTYASIADVAMRLAIDLLELIKFTYDFALEEKIINGDSLSTKSAQSGQSVSNNTEEARRSTSSFDVILKPQPAASDPQPPSDPAPNEKIDLLQFENGLAPPDPWDQPQTIKDDLAELTGVMSNAHLSTSPTSQQSKSPDALHADPSKYSRAAIEAAELFLPDGVAEQREHFCEFFETVRPAARNSSDVHHVFLSCDGDHKRALSFLKAFGELSEFGFEEDQISAALVVYEGDRDAALEHLMRSA